MNTDEPRIVQLFFDRDERAVSQTKEKYGSYCYRIAYDILRDMQDASECENDTYFRLWNVIPPNIPACFRTFLGRIVRNLSLDRKKHLTAKKRSNSYEILTELDRMLQSEQHPECEIFAQEMLEKIVLFLENQPAQTRIFFVQRYWYMKEIHEIAVMHGCSEGKVRVNLHRTRNSLRQMLSEEGYI